MMDANRVERLTDAEKEVLRLWVEDLTAKEIGLRLSLAERTIYQRLTKAKLKLGTDTPMQAALMLAQSEGRPTYAQSAPQFLHVESHHHSIHPLLQLLIPEASGSSINELGTGQRLIAIAVRAALFVLLLVGMVALLSTMSRVIRQLI